MSARNLGHDQLPALTPTRDARRAKQAGPYRETPTARIFEQKMASVSEIRGLHAINFIALEAGALT